jgi:Domain of unknown function (DUF5134)
VPASLLIRMVLTVAFLVAGALCLRRCFARAEDTTPIARLNDTTHVGMTVAMLAMVWAPPVSAWSLQVTAFAAASAWFLVQATGVPMSAHGLSISPAGTAGIRCARRGDFHRLGCLHHAALMLTTVWMLGAGPGMVMADHPAPPSWPLSRPAVLIGLYCLIATPVCVVAAIRGWRRGGTGRTAVAEPVMTAAMGGMALLLR